VIALRSSEASWAASRNGTPPFFLHPVAAFGDMRRSRLALVRQQGFRARICFLSRSFLEFVQMAPSPPRVTTGNWCNLAPVTLARTREPSPLSLPEPRPGESPSAPRVPPSQATSVAKAPSRTPRQNCAKSGEARNVLEFQCLRRGRG